MSTLFIQQVVLTIERSVLEYNNKLLDFLFLVLEACILEAANNASGYVT